MDTIDRVQHAIETDPSYEFPKLRSGDRVPAEFAPGALIEEKLDGEMLVVWPGRAYGRRPSSVSGFREDKWDQLPLDLQARVRSLTNLGPVVGELCVAGGTSSDVKTHLKLYHQGKEHRLRFVAHSLLARQDLPLMDQRMAIVGRGLAVPRVLQRDQVGEDALIGCFMPSDCQRYNHYQLSITVDRLRHLAARNQLEGFVVKVGLHEWYKVKVESTYDLVVTGTKPGKGKYQGMVGALLCSAYKGGELVEVAACSGMTDEERATMTRERHLLDGRVVEVKANEEASKGRLKWPRFIRFREDKRPQDCTWPQ